MSELKKRPELDQFREHAERKAFADYCEGECNPHSQGKRHVVHVYGPDDGFDWGYFSYCDAAIEEDESRGFRVIRDDA